MPRALTSVMVLWITASAFAFESKLVSASNAPLRDAQVSIVGRSGSVRSDAAGRFTVDAEPPFTLIVTGNRGEIYDPIHVTGPAEELRVEALLLETITVTGGIAPNIDALPGAATSVVGREEIEQRNPAHIVDALARTAGIERRGEGSPGVPVLRGLAGGRTLVILDDARLTAERRAGPSATFLDPFTLGSIEVARGAGSVAYGSDAFGGVIHARPKDPSPGDRGARYHFSASSGGSATRGAGIDFLHDVGGGAVLASVRGRDSNSSEAGGGDRIPNAAWSDHGLSLRFVRAGERRTWRIGFTADRGRDIGAPAADALVQEIYYPKEDATRLTLATDISGLKWSEVEFRGAIGNYRIITNRERLPLTGVTRQIASSDVDANDASARFAAARATAAGRLRVGADFVSRFGLSADGTTERFDASNNSIAVEREISIGSATRNDFGLFATIDRDLGSLLVLSAGGRVDLISVRNDGGFFGDRERNDQALSGYVAMTAAPRRNVTLTLQAASGYREPTLSDRYFRGVSGRGFVIGNPDLDPERSLQFDGTARWSSGARSVALYAYHYRIDDLIERFRAGNDFNFRNRGRAVVKGAEIEIALPITMQLAVQANATLARGEALDDGAPLDDISAPNAHVALRWQRERISAFLHGFVYGDDDRPGPVETARDGYETLDAGLGFRLNERFDIRLHAENIFDKRRPGSADANAALAPGRTISITLGGMLGW